MMNDESSCFEKGCELHTPFEIFFRIEETSKSSNQLQHTHSTFITLCSSCLSLSTEIVHQQKREQQQLHTFSMMEDLPQESVGKPITDSDEETGSIPETIEISKSYSMSGDEFDADSHFITFFEEGTITTAKEGEKLEVGVDQNHDVKRERTCFSLEIGIWFVFLIAMGFVVRILWNLYSDPS
jgi:hypothetical protein